MIKHNVHVLNYKNCETLMFEYIHTNTIELSEIINNVKNDIPYYIKNKFGNIDNYIIKIDDTDNFIYLIDQDKNENNKPTLMRTHKIIKKVITNNL
jgi:hypothetical protein